MPQENRITNLGEEASQGESVLARGQKMDRLLAARTVRKYVCARCWGRLNQYFEQQETLVVCANPDCDGRGFVTRHYAEKQRQKSIDEKREVNKTLQEMGIVENPHAGKSADQLIEELGF